MTLSIQASIPVLIRPYPTGRGFPDQFERVQCVNLRGKDKTYNGQHRRNVTHPICLILAVYTRPSIRTVMFWGVFSWGNLPDNGEMIGVESETDLMTRTILSQEKSGLTSISLQ